MRKEKIYCDKWVHEGRCAFAQQGCKYKHEMPLDKATQEEVGLYLGLPSWFKRKQALELKAAMAVKAARNPFEDESMGMPTPTTASATMGDGSGRGPLQQLRANMVNYSPSPTGPGVVNRTNTRSGKFYISHSSIITKSPTY